MKAGLQRLLLYGLHNCRHALGLLHLLCGFLQQSRSSPPVYVYVLMFVLVALSLKISYTLNTGTGMPSIKKGVATICMIFIFHISMEMITCARM